MSGLAKFFSSRKNQLSMFFTLIALLGYLVIKFPSETTKAGQALFTQSEAFYIVITAWGINASARLLQYIKTRVPSNKGASGSVLVFLAGMAGLLKDMRADDHGTAAQSREKGQEYPVHMGRQSHNGLIVALILFLIQLYRYYYCAIGFTEFWEMYAVLYSSYVSGSVDGKAGNVKKITKEQYMGIFKDGTA